MKVYHGSAEKFNQFDYSRIGKNGTSEGIGFYFTDSLDVAKAYGENGYVYEVEFKGTKQLSHRKVTIKPSQLAAYFKHLHKHLAYLDNYGDVEYEGLDKVLRMAVKAELEYVTNDVDLIGSICNGCGDIRVALTVLNKVLGYDSIVLDADWGKNKQKLYIALVNSAIEITRVVKTVEMREPKKQVVENYKSIYVYGYLQGQKKFLFETTKYERCKDVIEKLLVDRQKGVLNKNLQLYERFTASFIKK